MYLLGFYGVSDAGKTTLVEKLSESVLTKYNIERKRGITLKVNYASFSNKESYYMLDHPGHQAWSIESLRNVNLIDFALYMIDPISWNLPTIRKNTLDHYRSYMKVFEELKIPVIVLINKVESCEKARLLEVFDGLSKVSVYPRMYIPVSSFVDKSIVQLKDLLDDYVRKTNFKEKKLEGVSFRTIKSFDLNPVGVPLKKIIGGVLGGYFYEELDPTITYYLKSKDSKELNQININRILKKGKIGTIETLSDPCYFRTDLKKGSFLIKETDKDKVKSIDTNSFITLKVNTWIKKPTKNEQVLLLLEGQLFTCTLKKFQKEVVLLKKDLETFPLCFYNSHVIILNVKAENRIQEILAVGQIKKIDSSKGSKLAKSL